MTDTKARLEAITAEIAKGDLPAGHEIPCDRFIVVGNQGNRMSDHPNAQGVLMHLLIDGRGRPWVQACDDDGCKLVLLSTHPIV